MNNRITENTIEEFAIELLERLGYQYIYAPDLPVRCTQTGIVPDGIKSERNSYEDVLLTERLQELIVLLNKTEKYISRKYIKPMIDSGDLQYRFPEMINHPNQAYLSKKKS